MLQIIANQVDIPTKQLRKSTRQEIAPTNRYSQTFIATHYLYIKIINVLNLSFSVHSQKVLKPDKPCNIVIPKPVIASCLLTIKHD